MTDPPASTVRAPRPASSGDLDQIAQGTHALPHDVLGAHRHGGAVTIRTMRPWAEGVDVVLPGGERTPLHHEHEGEWDRHQPGNLTPETI